MFERLRALTKGFREMVHPGRGLVIVPLPRTEFDYTRDVGDGTGSSVLAGPIQWIQRAFPEAPLIIEKLTQDGADFIPDHPLSNLIKNPNPFYGGEILWMATLYSWTTAGNAYWMKIRNNARQIVQLWYVPHWMIRPRWPEGQDTTTFISHYEYKPGSMWLRIEPEPDGDLNIVHIRHGLDPNNIRLGISPLAGCLREVWMDDEASNWVASLLRNSGIPGVIISPDSDVQPMEGDVDAMKQYFKDMFTRDRRGEPLVMGAKTRVEQFGFDPKSMDLSHVRNVAEERICAALGIPAAVVGFGTGLEATKVGATMTEMRKLAWMNGIIPIQNIIAAEVSRSLLKEFEARPEQFHVSFDRSEVASLQEDMNELVTRIDTAVKGGWIKVNTAQELAGFPVDESQDIYLRSIATIEVRSTDGPRSIDIDDNEDDDLDNPKSNGHDLSFKIDIPSPAEAATIARAPKRKPGVAQLRAVRFLEDLEVRQAKRFATILIKSFDSMGKQVLDAWNETIKASTNGVEKKQDLPSDIELEQVIERVPWSQVREDFTNRYGGHFGQVARETYSNMNLALGLTVNLEDTAARRVIADGGRRLGLIDFRKQTKEKLFRLLLEAREAGEGVNVIVRRIRNEIPAGKFKDVKTRARLIAQTETKYAQNRSMIEYTEAAGARQAMVFDNRKPGGLRDDTCIALNNTIVDLDIAQQLVDEEHPNGTRSFTPWFG